MKKAILSILVLFIALASSAQQKKPVTVKINTPSVQCEMCKKKIEEYLMYEEGVTKALVDYKQKKTTVTYLTDRTNLDNIKTAIANTGYDAEEVKAAADEFVSIPMYGFTESFNISVSVAILLNTLRKRLVDSDIEWKLSQEEQTDLKIEWCKKILRSGQALENEFNKQLLKKDL